MCVLHIDQSIDFSYRLIDKHLINQSQQAASLQDPISPGSHDEDGRTTSTPARPRGHDAAAIHQQQQGRLNSSSSTRSSREIGTAAVGCVGPVARSRPPAGGVRLPPPAPQRTAAAAASTRGTISAAACGGDATTGRSVGGRDFGKGRGDRTGSFCPTPPCRCR